MSRRAALAAYAALTAATIAWVALVPGEPRYESSGAGSLGAALLLGAAIVLALALVPAVGWYVAVALDGVGSPRPRGAEHPGQTRTRVPPRR